MGNRFFSKVQFGKETPASRGTAVAADTIILGKVPAVGSDRKPTFPSEDVGINTPSVRSVIHQYLYQNTLSTEHGYFQQLPALFGCALKGGVTPTETTPSQLDYLWAQTPSLLTGVDNAADSMTIELGDDTQAFEAEYAMFERIRISGTVAQGQDASPVSVEADFFSRQLTPTTFTGSIALPTAEPMNGKLARFYLDTTWAGVGATEKANILRAFDIEIVTGLHPKFSGSGNKYFNEHGQGLITVTANFTLEGTTAANAIMTAQQAKTFQVVRLKLEGGQIGTGANHSLSLDIGGEWETVSPLSSEDRGDNMHSAVLVGRYDSTGAKMLQVATVTNVASY
jgi:hypothetical protein